MTATLNRNLLIALTGVLALSPACASFNPTPIDDVGFKDRAQTQTKNDITVTVSVLSAEETRAVFDTKLYKKKIQPIWVEVTNGTDQPHAFLPRSVDPNYHSALEVAQKSLKTWAKKSNQAKRRFYYLNTMQFEVAARANPVRFCLWRQEQGPAMDGRGDHRREHGRVF